MRGQLGVGQERRVSSDVAAAGLRDLTIKEGTAAVGADSRSREKHQAGNGKSIQVVESMN